MDVIINELVWIRRSFFACFFISDVSAVISSARSNTYLPINYFWHEQLLVSKYSTVLHALLESQALEFNIWSFSKQP